MNNPSLEYIENRLSLRKPQRESIEILDKIADYIFSNETLDEKLRKIKLIYNSVSSFERDFPSLCFSLATGVGKTRLMGAFIAYLYITKGIRNFIVIAPNITIYNKLISDFGDSGSEKYVFKGLKEFVQNEPYIVTGENYKEQGRSKLFNSDITINIFNIDKINKEEQSIKSLSEYLGQSYYNFLVNLDNLVMLMDESHHYRADRGMKVLNELNPVLGLELTATPRIEKGNKSIKFKNIIYDYPLSKAMLDGFVKEPSVATKKNFNIDNYSPDELDKIKLNDGLLVHEDTKVALEQYSKANKVKLVKPFVMVICKSIEHANDILNYIKSSEFFGGKYKNKVMMITSKDGKVEKDINIQRLLSLENPINPFEIVVHVNILKEGWDVNNLYTIIPLRRSASQTLTEQTMGRGLRLPYGIRTGNEKIDRLTIISHDKYQEIIDEANKETSILKASNIEYIEDMDLQPKEVVESNPTWLEEINSKIEKENDTDKLIELSIEKEIKKNIGNQSLNNIELDDEEIKNNAVNNISNRINPTIDIKSLVNKVYDNCESRIKDETITSELKTRINIPYISINKSTTFEQEYNDFKLDLSKLNYKPLDNEMIIKHLGDGDSIEIKIGNESYQYRNAKEILFDKLNSIPNLDYEKCADILNSKITEYLQFLSSKYDDNDVLNILYNYCSYISKEISKQIVENISIKSNISTEPIIKEYDKILNPTYTKYSDFGIVSFDNNIEDRANIRKYIFEGFKKSCHKYYKFDSDSERQLSIILENSKSVLKWIRPADNQFNIYWTSNNKYQPDFVVETNVSMYMIEVKADNQIVTEEVQLKKKAGENYCQTINDYGKNHKIKKWFYIIIPSSDIKTNYDFDRYMK